MKLYLQKLKPYLHPFYGSVIESFMIFKWLFLKVSAICYFGWRKGDNKKQAQHRFIKFGNKFFKAPIPYHLYESYEKYISSYSKNNDEFTLYNEIFPQKKWLDNKVILDLGGGCGYYSKRLLEEGAQSVSLLEIQKRKVTFAKENYGKLENYNIFNASAYQMPLEDKSFDSIFSHTVFEHITDMDATLSECHRVLKDNGVMIIGFNYFHHYGGSHLFPYIHFPWVNWIVSETEACAYWSKEVLKDIENKQWSYYDKSCVTSHLGNGSEMNLNRLTFDDFERYLNEYNFKIVGKKPSGALVQLLPFLKYVPYIKYPLTGTVFYAIEKKRND